MEPAISLITKIGNGNFAKGVNRLHLWTGIKKDAIYRWRYPVEKGGTGGVVPSQHQQKILDAARREGVPLTTADFFLSPADADEPQEILPAGSAIISCDLVLLATGQNGPVAYLNGEQVSLAVIEARIAALKAVAA
jgi:hypothetical protein